MFEYLEGKLSELNPAYVVVDCGGVGYFVNISVHTFSLLQGKQSSRIFVHQVIREDLHSLYGFAEKFERELFRYLISVSGIGANTARVMMSHASPVDVRSAIVSGNDAFLKSIKGIGLKTAQRIVIELKDKVLKMEGTSNAIPSFSSSCRDEAVSALTVLGFSKNIIEKSVDKILAEDPTLSVESLVVKALKNL